MAFCLLSRLHFRYVGASNLSIKLLSTGSDIRSQYHSNMATKTKVLCASRRWRYRTFISMASNVIHLHFISGENWKKQQQTIHFNILDLVTFPCHLNFNFYDFQHHTIHWVEQVASAGWYIWNVTAHVTAISYHVTCHYTAMPISYHVACHCTTTPMSYHVTSHYILPCLYIYTWLIIIGSHLYFTTWPVTALSRLYCNTWPITLHLPINVLLCSRHDSWLTNRVVANRGS